MNFWVHGREGFLAVPCHAAGWSSVAESVELQVEVGGEEGEQGAGLRLWEGTGFGDGLG